MFNYMHWTTGLVLLITTLINVAIGLQLNEDWVRRLHPLEQYTPRSFQKTHHDHCGVHSVELKTYLPKACNVVVTLL